MHKTTFTCRGCPKITGRCYVVAIHDAGVISNPICPWGVDNAAWTTETVNTPMLEIPADERLL